MSGFAHRSGDVAILDAAGGNAPVTESSVVCIADSRPSIHRAVKEILSKAEFDWTILVARSCGELTETLNDSHVDALILGRIGGYPATGDQVAALVADGLRVVVMLDVIDKASAREMMAMGIHGILRTPESPESLRLLVGDVIGGAQVLSPPAQSVLFDSPSVEPWARVLSNREAEILALMARGLTTDQISRRLSVSVGTVKTHKARLYDKLEVGNAAGAVAEATKRGLIGHDDVTSNRRRP